MKTLFLSCLIIVLRTTANTQPISKDSLYYKFPKKIDSVVNKAILTFQGASQNNKLCYITLERNESGEVVLSIQSTPSELSPQFKSLLLNSNRYFRTKHNLTVTILTDWDYIFGNHLSDKERGGGYVIRLKDDEILFSGYSQ